MIHKEISHEKTEEKQNTTTFQRSRTTHLRIPVFDSVSEFRSRNTAPTTRHASPERTAHNHTPMQAITHPRRLVRKRQARTNQKLGMRVRLHRGMAIFLITMLFLGIVTPLGIGLVAYNVYTHASGLAHSGINHLLNVKTLLPVSKRDPMAVLDTHKLQQAQHEFQRAENDFVQLQQVANQADIQTAMGTVSLDYSGTVLTAKHLITVALDVTRMGQEATKLGLLASTIVHGSPLSQGSDKPLISANEIEAIDEAIAHGLYYLDDIRTQMSQVNLRDLPLSTRQQQQFAGLLAELPQAHALLTQAQSLTSMISWLLGVGQARQFLVQTMDRAELRPSGGFTGQYGILRVQNGRVAPFNLRDVALLDYAGNGAVLGRTPPPQYDWMNFGNWGLRDSNLSADYPTTAQMSMQVFADEGGGPVDGDISFTPTFIEHILDVTGPIHVAEYDETITPQNLEERLHYYQQDYGAIALQEAKTNDTSHAVRKAFTSLVGKMLLDRVRHLSVSQLVKLAKNAVKDLQSRDLEIYLTNPQAEQWLLTNGYSGAMRTFTQQDGFMVAQANISISKASQYVHTTEHDDVTLDAQGGATHHLTITLDYQQRGQVYGFDTYADYIRVYTPESAQLLSGDGFDTGVPLCNPQGNVGCASYKVSPPSAARYCPDGNYDLGEHLHGEPWVINSLGGPTALISDLPHFHMWGGLTETPKNCLSYISLSWYVPHAFNAAQGQSPYTLLVEKQGGYVPRVEINVDTSKAPAKGLHALHAQGDLIADQPFSLAVPRQ